MKDMILGGALINIPPGTPIRNPPDALTRAQGGFPIRFIRAQVYAKIKVGIKILVPT